MSRTIATMTLARNPGERSRILDSMHALADHGLPIVVADGGSGSDFCGELEKIRGVRVVAPAGAGLVGQIAASLAAARDGGAERVLYTEPDKLEFFTSGLGLFLEATKEESARLAMAGRSDGAFSTFPPMQRAAEHALNGVLAQLTGVPGDYCYGPFEADSRLLQAIDQFDTALGWGWRIALFVRAAAVGNRIRIINGEHVCPDEQLSEADAETAYRIRQLSQNVAGALVGLESELGIRRELAV